MVTARVLADHLDALLRVREIPDYPGALNGLQCDHEGPVRRIGAAVDFSLRCVEAAAARGVNFLVVHHGMFWGGTQPLTGAAFRRVRLLFAHDMAVYSAHLPLDAHPSYGNNVLLAHALGLEPAGGFASYEGTAVGVAGEADMETAGLLAAADRFARAHGGTARASAFDAGRRTRRWGVCTGAGASSTTLREARAAGLDTLITGEGPHHTAVEAPEAGLVVIYAGHYATETLGVRALGEHLAATFGVPAEYIAAPTGL